MGNRLKAWVHVRSLIEQVVNGTWDRSRSTDIITILTTLSQSNHNVFVIKVSRSRQFVDAGSRVTDHRDRPAQQDSESCAPRLDCFPVEGRTGNVGPVARLA